MVRVCEAVRFLERDVCEQPTLKRFRAAPSSMCTGIRHHCVCTHGASKISHWIAPQAPASQFMSLRARLCVTLCARLPPTLA
eukprot:3330416-Alexandrium_andersonii.AAC.1